MLYVAMQYFKISKSEYLRCASKCAISKYKQESPAVADKLARRESMLKLLQFEILRKFKLIEFKIIQGHRSWCRSKAHM